MDPDYHQKKKFLERKKRLGRRQKTICFTVKSRLSIDNF